MKMPKMEILELKNEFSEIKKKKNLWMDLTAKWTYSVKE